MAARSCVVILLCVGVCGVFSEDEVVGSICRSHERFLSCGGCQKTCRDPAPVCVGVCRTGCYCNEDEVRNDTGHCVKLADCPPMEMAALHTSEPRHSDSQCPPDEEYRSCEPCNRTCDNPNPVCPAQCARGCFCREGLLKDKDGRCVPEDSCLSGKKTDQSNFIKPITYQLTCGPHQNYACRTCEQTCSSPTPECHVPCRAGCFCDDGFVKAPSGQCVKPENCPRAEETPSAAHEPAIEDCSSDEIYLSCGWCEPSCWDPHPECPRGVCTRGCLCKPPLLRHHSGHCVAESDCSPQKCSEPNEEFVCRYGCEARCDAQKCIARPRRCVLGCHCKLGWLRDNDGKCVSQDNCRNYTLPSNFNITKSSPDSKIYPANASEDTRIVKVKHNDTTVHNVQVTVKAPKSVFDVEDPKYARQDKIRNQRPFKDAISRAVKIYKEFIHPSPLNNNMYLAKTIKDLSSPKFHRDENIILFNDNIFNVKDPENRTSMPYFAGLEAKPKKEVKVKNYMNDFINVMKEMMPQPVNFTFINYPVFPLP